MAVLVGWAAASVAAPAQTVQAHELPTWAGPSLAHQRQLVREAETFMADYARLLLAGDRARIAALYDPDGAVLVRNGRRTMASRADIVAQYASESWQPPATFTWRNLYFAAAGPETVVVLGEFVWGEAESSMTGTYHAILRRENGALVIWIEDEAAVPSGAR